jgi:chromosome segregation ATPase
MKRISWWKILFKYSKRIADLESENSELEFKMVGLESKIARLGSKNVEFKARNAGLESKNVELKVKIADFEFKMSELGLEIEEKDSEIADLTNYSSNLYERCQEESKVELDKLESIVKEILDERNMREHLIPIGEHDEILSYYGSQLIQTKDELALEKAKNAKLKEKIAKKNEKIEELYEVVYLYPFKQGSQQNQAHQHLNLPQPIAPPSPIHRRTLSNPKTSLSSYF